MLKNIFYAMINKDILYFQIIFHYVEQKAQD